MTEPPAPRPAVTAAGADDAARARVAALFEQLDRLTTDDLGRIAIRVPDDPHRRALRARLDRVAAASGRTALLAEARDAVREVLLQRYGAGTYRPTWAGLNWGLSMGRAEDRTAVVAAVEDAAGAAVLRDLLDPDEADALAIDADHVLGLATGTPDGPFRNPKTMGWPARATFVVLLLAFAGTAVAAGIGYGAPAMLVVVIGIVLVFAGLMRAARRP